MYIIHYNNDGSTLQNNSLGVDVDIRLGIGYNRDLVGAREGTNLGEEIAQAHK